MVALKWLLKMNPEEARARLRRALVEEAGSATAVARREGLPTATLNRLLHQAGLRGVAEQERQRAQRRFRLL